MSTTQHEAGLHLCPDLAGTLMTPEEFDSAESWDESFEYELIRGVLIVTPPVSEGERGPNDELGYLLRSYRESHPQGKSLDLTLPESYVRTADSRRRADRVIWAGKGKIPDVRRGQPNIVVEFVSAGKRDRQRDYVEKRNEYLAAGIDEYWIFDRFRRILTVVRRGGAEIIVKEADSYQTPLLPGFALRPAELFAVADAIDRAASSDPSDT